MLVVEHQFAEQLDLLNLIVRRRRQALECLRLDEKRRMLADGDQSMSRRGHGPSLNYGISPALGEAAAGSLFRLTTIPALAR